MGQVALIGTHSSSFLTPRHIWRKFRCIRLHQIGAEPPGVRRWNPGGGGQYPAPRRVHTGFRWAELDNHREREWQRRISDEYRIWCRHLQGGFFLPKKVNSNVEWGAWNDCNVYGSASTYVHSISAQLWMQTGAFAFQKTKQETAMSPLESVSSKVVTAHRVKKCDTTYTKEFQIQAEVTLKSKKMGVVKSDNVKLACNFKVS